MSLGIVQDEFDPQIFRCRDRSPTPTAALEQLPKLHAALVVLRDFIRSTDGGNKPHADIYILSGYRSPAYNARVGGEKASKHMLGQAADISVPGVRPSKVYGLADHLQRDGSVPLGGLGKYATFVHLDIRGDIARWVVK